MDKWKASFAQCNLLFPSHRLHDNGFPFWGPTHDQPKGLSSGRRGRILMRMRIRGLLGNSYSTVLTFLWLMQESVVISFATIQTTFFRSPTVLSLVVISQTTATQILFLSNFPSVINTHSFVSFTVPDYVTSTANITLLLYDTKVSIRPFPIFLSRLSFGTVKVLQLSLDTLIPQLSSLE